jgi:thiol-disulfide isomerase/thioredoxin
MATKLSFLYLSIAVSTTLPAQQPTADTILHQLSQKLSSLSTVSYHYRRELNYASENYNNILEADIYLQFDPAQLPTGILYQAHRPDTFEVFNGSQIIHGVASSHTLQMTAIHSVDALKNNSLLFNSFATLRAALPALIDDSSITKSVESCNAATCVVAIKIPRATLNAAGTLSPIQLQRDITYRITIDRATMLPTKVRQTNSANTDFMDTQFSSLNLNPAKPAPSSWLYTSYPDYKLVFPANAPTPLAVGSTAPSWTLPLLDNASETISLNDVLKQPNTKLVLIEFWITYCGHSIDAVLTLNSIARRYKDSLKVVAINPDDSAPTMKLFQKNFAPHYPLLAEGTKAAQQYGVSAYPTVFLVNREGKIIYAGDADQTNLQNAIKTAAATEISVKPSITQPTRNPNKPNH